MKTAEQDMKLIKCSDYVLEQRHVKNKDGEVNGVEYAWKVIRYANFLKKPLELGMFVPCVDGKPIQSVFPPMKKDADIIGFTVEEMRKQEAFEQYQEAKDRVLFDNVYYVKYLESFRGFEKHQFIINNVQKDILFSPNKTIEDLIPYGLTLTQSAIKQING